MRGTSCVLAACGLFLAGCAEKKEPGPEKPAEAVRKSETSIGDVVDYLTGKTQIEIKKRTEEKLDQIQRERERQMREILGEEAAPPPDNEPPPR